MKVEEKNTSGAINEKISNDEKIKTTDVPNENKKTQDEKNINIDDSETKNQEEKVKELEEKILRTLAEMENQRRRFEKEREDAFEFGGFAFAKESLALVDNLERAKTSFSNNKKLKENDNFPKIL